MTMRVHNYDGVHEDCGRADERPTVHDKAEQLLGYWEIHENDPEAVARWAIQDMMGFLRYFVEAD